MTNSPVPNGHLLTESLDSSVQTPSPGMLSAASLSPGQQLCSPGRHVHGCPLHISTGQAMGRRVAGRCGGSTHPSEKAKQAVAFHQRRPAKKTLFPQMCSSFKIVQAKVSIVLWPLLII